MAGQNKDGKGGKGIDQELDDWAAAIDEWDANLALPSPTGPKAKVDPADLVEPTTDPTPPSELLLAATRPQADRGATPTPVPPAITPPGGVPAAGARGAPARRDDP